MEGIEEKSVGAAIADFQRVQSGTLVAMRNVFVTTDPEDPSKLIPGILCKNGCEHGGSAFCTECIHPMTDDPAEGERLVPRQ